MARLALSAACLRSEFGAVVDYYGVHPRVSLELQNCKAKILGVFAENDEFIPASAVRALGEFLVRAAVEHDLLTYDGVQHAFLNEARPDVYDAEMAVYLNSRSGPQRDILVKNIQTMKTWAAAGK